jgi:diguanylate cyclase (GGDEF)-like protein
MARDGGASELAERLAGATTVAAAADVVADHCVAVGYELPSLYLERGGRLRCMAQRGYWQVFDGMPAGAGVLGRTYQAGTLHVVRDTTSDPLYIGAVAGVRSEVCVPLRYDGRTVGAFNVETTRALCDADVGAIQDIGAAFEVRLAELGGPPQERLAEVLARVGYELACLDDREAIVEHTLAAATSLAEMSSACLYLDDPQQGYVVRHRGPQGELLAGLPAEVLAQLARYVEQSTSSYTTGESQGGGLAATDVLRASGIRSLIVLALMAKGRREGMLVAVDEVPRPGLPRFVPVLELLASTAAAMIAAAGSSAALQRSQRRLAHQARHDPLTGLANRAHFMAELEEQLRVEDDPLGPFVLFVDLDHFKQVNDGMGHRVGDLLLTSVADRLRSAARASDLVARLGGDEFVLLCRRVATRDDAGMVARRVIDRLGTPFHVEAERVTLSACVGISGSWAGAAAEDVVEAADRAMYEAKRAGSGSWAMGPAREEAAPGGGV